MPNFWVIQVYVVNLSKTKMLKHKSSKDQSIVLLQQTSIAHRKMKNLGLKILNLSARKISSTPPMKKKKEKKSSK